MKEKIEVAIVARKEGRGEEALALFGELLKTSPQDPILHYQMAWTHDSLGQESQAVSYYERALEYGLKGEDLRGALLGLGSTYRCLGEYVKSKAIFDQAIEQFPADRSFVVFRSLTQYNLGFHKEAVGDLLLQLLDTTADSQIKMYDRALRFYADKLDQTWTD
jgi:tetratricopeptide (TPR) repeat protein